MPPSKIIRRSVVMISLMCAHLQQLLVVRWGIEIINANISTQQSSRSQFFADRGLVEDFLFRCCVVTLPDSEPGPGTESRRSAGHRWRK